MAEHKVEFKGQEFPYVYEFEIDGAESILDCRRNPVVATLMRGTDKEQTVEISPISCKVLGKITPEVRKAAKLVQAMVDSMS